MAHASGRVLLLLSHVFADGGIQRFNRTLLAASAMRDARIDVMTLRDSPADVPAPIRGLGSVMAFENKRLRFVARVARAILGGRYRLIVVGHVNLLVVTAMLRAILPRRPRLWMIAHGVEVWRSLNTRRAAALRSLDLCLSVSRYTRDSIIAQVPGIDASRLPVFPNALAATWQTDVATGGYREHALPERFLLSVARLDEPDRTKGIITTIEALAMTGDDSLHLVIAGYGNDLPFLRRVAARAGVSGRVHFLGRVDDATLAELYRKCLAFVLPSGQEGFGIVYLEAAFHGAPLVGARSKGVVDVIADRETGLLVDYGDRIGLAHVLEQLARDHTFRDRLRHNARALVTCNGRFTFDAYRDRWRGLLRQADIMLSEPLGP
jgi:phosphatidylinositol alpha-1,6-mannosyltransferase